MAGYYTSGRYRIFTSVQYTRFIIIITASINSQYKSDLVDEYIYVQPQDSEDTFTFMYLPPGSCSPLYHCKSFVLWF